MSKQHYILKIASRHGSHEARGWLAILALACSRIAPYVAAIAGGGVDGTLL